MTLSLRLPDAQATQALGTRLAASLSGPAVVYLHGDLGAGKSALARAMLTALGAPAPIRSPTYTLLERHALARGEAAHLDLYRIAQADELEFLGLQDLLPDLRLVLVNGRNGGRAPCRPPTWSCAWPWRVLAAGSCWRPAARSAVRGWRPWRRPRETRLTKPPEPNPRKVSQATDS